MVMRCLYRALQKLERCIWWWVWILYS